MKTDRKFGCKPELQSFAPRVLIKRLIKGSVPFLAVSVLALSLGAAFSASPVQAQALPGVYTNSWLGNTYGMPGDHIQHDIDGLYVTPSGKVVTAASWDEGGTNAAIYSATGAKIGIIQNGTGSWGRHGGWTIFADDSYVYHPMR